MSAITWAILACGAALMRLGAKPGIERTAYVALFCVCPLHRQAPHHPVGGWLPLWLFAIVTYQRRTLARDTRPRPAHRSGGRGLAHPHHREAHSQQAHSMSDETPQIEDIRRLHLDPGDVIVLKVQHPLTQAQADRMVQRMRAVLPGHKCLVLDHDVDLTVVSAGPTIEQTTRPQRWSVFQR
jgi:hypothetical protein